MRPNQNKRMRGRNNNNNNNNNRKGPNPLSRSYESNGPDVKIRGTAHHIGEKYLQLARDAQSSGDPVMAESFLQHAEHYFRLIAAAQAAQGFQRQPGEADTDECDEDDDFGGGMDRFASPIERVANVQPSYPAVAAGQPPYPDRERSSYSNGERPLYERPERGPRQERSFQDRSFQDRGDRNERGDRGFQDRNLQERSFQQDRPVPDRQGGQGRDGEPRPSRGGRGGRDYRADTRYERGEPRAAATEIDGNTGLPAFITSPVRLQPEQHLGGVEDQPIVTNVLDHSVADNEGAGFHLRPRRRRRSKAEMAESQTEIAPARDPVGD